MPAIAQRVPSPEAPRAGDSAHGAWRGVAGFTARRPRRSRLQGTALAALLTPALALAARLAGAAPFDPPRTLDTRVLADAHWLAEGRTALRVAVRDAATDRPLDAEVSLSLRPLPAASAASAPARRPAAERRLWEGRTNALGTLDLALRLPPLPLGAYQLRVSVASPEGPDHVELPVLLVDGAAVHVATDRTLYAPGDVVHVRALALLEPTLKPASGAELLLDVHDPSGLRLLRRRVAASPHGVVALDLPLASVLRLGTYVVRAALLHGASETSFAVAERPSEALDVRLDLGRPFCIAGERVEGSIAVREPSGLPVAAASVRLAARAAAYGPAPVAIAEGRTDRAGRFSFAFELGAPSNEGDGWLALDVEAVDDADRRAGTAAHVPLAREPLLLALQPDAPPLLPGVENVVVASASSADGSALTGAIVRYEAGGRSGEARTDDSGRVEIRVLPVPGTAPLLLRARVEDGSGKHGTLERELRVRGAHGVTLELPRAANPGDRVPIVVRSDDPAPTVYVDVARGGRTLLARSAALKDGAATLNLALPPDVTGLLEVRAYRLARGTVPDGEVRSLWVPHPRLDVQLAEQGPADLTGDVTRISVDVRDEHGSGTAAVLAAWVLDGRTAPLAGLLPGAAELHFLGGHFPAGHGPAHSSPAALPHPRLAAPARGLELRASSYETRLDRAKRSWAPALTRDAAGIEGALRRRLASPAARARPLPAGIELNRLVRLQLLFPREAKDPWGRWYRAAFDDGRLAGLRSAGPDGRFETLDDIDWRPQAPAEDAAGGRVSRRSAAHADAAGEEGEPPALRSPPMLDFHPRAAGGLTSFQRDPGLGTLAWAPEMRTDAFGHASFDVPVALARAGLRAGASASSARGQLGGGGIGLPPSRELAPSLELPAVATVGDEFGGRVVIRSQASVARTARLDLGTAPALHIADARALDEVTLRPGESLARSFALEARAPGAQVVTLAVSGAGVPRHALATTIDVRPLGRDVAGATGGRLRALVEQTPLLPVQALAGTGFLRLRIDAGPVAHARATLDAFPALSSAGAEGAASALHAAGLAEAALRRRTEGDPALVDGIERARLLALERLAVFEASDGGFSARRGGPLSRVITAQALLAFAAAPAEAIDPALLARTQRWLVGQQRADGSYARDGGAPAEDAVDTPTADLRTTAYAAWALTASRATGAEAGRALDWVRHTLPASGDPYAVAVAANALAAMGSRAPGLAGALDRLLEMRAGEGDTTRWESGGTVSGAWSRAATVETTGLAAGALLVAGRDPEVADAAVDTLLGMRDARGVWATTQATLWALRAVLLEGETPPSVATGRVLVAVNGEDAGTLDLDGTAPVELDLRPHLRAGRNRVELRHDGFGTPAWLLVSGHVLPWTAESPSPPTPLRVSVDYGAGETRVAERLRARVRVENTSLLAAPDPVLAFDLPPGFLVAPLFALVAAGELVGFEAGAASLRLLLPAIPPSGTASLDLDLLAVRPGRVRSGATRAFEAYEPDAEAVVPPVPLRIRG